MKHTEMDYEWPLREPPPDVPYDGSHGGFLTRIGVPGRVLLLFVGVAMVYTAARGVSHFFFAPKLEVQELVLPHGPVEAGDSITVGAVVQNLRASSGAGFVVAVHPGGIEVEGPTIDVPPWGWAILPVEVVANSGGDPMALVVFDGWRGERHLHTYRSVSFDVRPRTFEPSRISLPGPVTRGDTLTLGLHWSNPGPIPETVVPVVVSRSEAGGPPTSMQGQPHRFEAGESRSMEVLVDTWFLLPGTHLVDIHVVSEAGRRAGHGTGPLMVEIQEP